MVDHNDYAPLLEFLKGNQDSQQFRRELARKAFQHVASYDSAVSEWLWKQSAGGNTCTVSLPDYIGIRVTLTLCSLFR